ncbi:MAG: hypothetical protein CMF48_05760 [Legionellales bacterium]|nr:hypothetical protein [Legionellales bacterium]|tara:strand:- start:70 stop:717 length:648 start_codon:yes stop_codon:yes gene_type:complete
MIDLYCERTSFTLWAEPLNLWTNLGFIVAAYAIHNHLKGGLYPKYFWLLPLFLYAIGLGSFAFHLYPIWETMMLDVVPITLFSLSAIIIIQKDLLQVSIPINIASLIFFLVISLLAEQLIQVNWLNNSQGYIPNWLYLGTFASILTYKAHTGGRWLMFAFLVFTTSLMARTVDPLLCQYWPYGTHFLWHLLNAVGLWAICRAILSKASIAQGQPG